MFLAENLEGKHHPPSLDLHESRNRSILNSDVDGMRNDANAEENLNLHSF